MKTCESLLKEIKERLAGYSEPCLCGTIEETVCPACDKRARLYHNYHLTIAQLVAMVGCAREALQRIYDLEMHPASASEVLAEIDRLANGETE